MKRMKSSTILSQKKNFFDTAYCIKEINFCVQTFEYEIAIQDKKTSDDCYYHD